LPDQYPSDYAEWYDRYRYAKRWTEKECDFLESIIDQYCEGQPRVLDVACGTGRHAIELAGRGYRVIGVDISQQMIDHAKYKVKGLGLEVEFIVGDMRNLSFDREYGFSYMWFSSFPFLITNDDAISCLRGIHKSLVSGGVFVFQYSNSPWKRPLDECEEPIVYEHEDGDTRFIQTSKRKRCPEGNLIHRTIDTRRWRGGKEIEPIHEGYIQRIYSVDEIDLLARLTGFNLTKVYGSPDSGSGYPDSNEEIIPVLVSQTP
jgi:SAM-dependent methyltransferase